MEFFRPNTKIGFMRQRYIAAAFSIILFVASIAAIWINGLNLGLDFTGGTQIDVTFTQPVDVNQIRENLNKEGFEQAIVQTYTTKDISIRIGQQKGMDVAQIRAKVLAATPGAHVGQLQQIGAQVGKSLMTSGILAIIVSMLATMVYIALRFDYRFAISGAIALIHDPILILGVFAAFHLEFNLIVLAALLTVIGYSLNDTVVVYDRVRENFRKHRKKAPVEVMDLSINQTLSRTIMTSGLTLLVVIALFVYGGEVVHNFSLALIIGIVIGTYSSIYVAGSFAIAIGLSREALAPSTKVVDDTP
ncbi:MAG: protein translocase subunit SecF [Coxiellaceae bacterium]|nr:protein translocase subunit SecF [Coxiellaceae bacterium]